nr:glycosyltransferase [Ectothiorhodospira lacustris]
MIALLRALRISCKPKYLRKQYHRLIAGLIKRSGLFDHGHYLETNPDVAAAGTPPLYHYVAYGDREGRWPMPLFDPTYYRFKAKIKNTRVNALLHYCFVGRHEKRSPSSWFDTHYYLSQNKDVARSGLEPIHHYLHIGGQEGRSPNPQFDGAYYLRKYPEVAHARINPLVHYLSVGRQLGYSPRPGLDPNDNESQPSAHHDHHEAALNWASLQPPFSKTNPAILDVVVPVYKDRELTLRCLHSVLKATHETPFQLTVINDAGPDQTLTEALRRLSENNLISLHENTVNQGFVRSVNFGMSLHIERDVILLNSDTQVYDGWLDRLREAAYRHPRTASVTPLSNNATICSYPRFLHDTPYPLETPYEALDAMAARVNQGQYIEAPTGVGFCMYLRRDALQAIGTFDAETFGKGYGEENDWCQRAIEQGWKNFLAANIIVRHIGSASFQGEKAKRVSQAMKIMAGRHPDYHRNVEIFIRKDPLSGSRRRLDWERLKRWSKPENILIVCHSRGGGTERHVQEDTQRLQAEGKGVFYLRPERQIPGHVRITHPVCRQLLNLSPFRLEDTHHLASALKELHITGIHSHGLVDFPHKAPEDLRRLAETLDIPLEVDIHDYKVICPRINLADHAGRYCKEPEESGCDTCLAVEGNDFGITNIRDWRRMHHTVLKSSRAIWVPDEDVRKRLLRYYPDINLRVMSHEDLDLDSVPQQTPRIQSGEHLRIVIIGAISKIKGYDILLSCATDVRKGNLPIDFIVMGYTHNDRLLEHQGVEITGKYLEHEAMEQLTQLRPHAVWLPSTWPETYSYTLSLALKAGYPVFAFDIGAIANRLRQMDRIQTLHPLDLMENPQALNAGFLEFRRQHLTPDCTP